VYLTDGVANETAAQPGVSVDTATAENNAMTEVIKGQNKHKGKPNTVGVGKKGVDLDEDFLKQVADSNGGVYRNDPTFANLDEIYQNIAALNLSIGRINGFVFNDKNKDGVYQTGEDPIPNWTIKATSPSLVNPVTAKTDATGHYSLLGLCSAKYDVTEQITSPWKPTTQSVYTIGVVSGFVYNNVDFGNRYGYSIAGAVFNDINKNRFKDGSEQNVPGSIVTATSGTIINNADGSYLIDGLDEGTYLVSYTSPLPTDYILIYPKGAPPSFLVTVGDSCSVDTTTGGTCGSLGDVTGLNYSISNSIPWMQTNDLDVRLDSGFTNMIPATSLYPAFSLAQTPSGNGPGVLILGNGTSKFGAGKASSTNWVAGGGLYPEVYKNSSGSVSKVSYTALLAKAQQAKLATVDLSTLPSCLSLSNCSLPAILPSGIYVANGDVGLNAYTFQAGRKYVFLINGKVTVNGNIVVPTGASATFAAKKDITIDKNIGTAPSFPMPVGQVQGNFSTEGNFIIPGINDCVVGADKMLNMEGSIVVNAGATGGKFSYQRDLCGGNPQYPTFTLKPRLDFIFNAPTYLMQQQTFSSEVAP
jgi:hypothetical protein